MSASQKLSLFEGYGVELEYMLVDCKNLSVLPVSDQILQKQAGSLVNEVEVGPLCWSNELVLHVIELKTNGPSATLNGLSEHFQQGIATINGYLADLGGQMMPCGMHPWMNPQNETRLWPHGDNSIYSAYNRIFGCQGHGWSNIQSAHINLPFHGEDEFSRLHAAIRVILPLLPALAASSPIMEGRYSGLLDNRLWAYQQNQRKIQIITGTFIPEAVFSSQSYREQILQPIYQAIAPHDPEGILQHEWLNSRGAIARFDRDAIEIRLLDVQECPAADLAVISLICAVLNGLVQERWSSLENQQGWSESVLAKWLLAAIGDGERARIDDTGFLSLFGFAGKRATMGDLWQYLASDLRPDLVARKGLPLEVILNQGPLARRIIKSAGETPSRLVLKDLYGQLCTCLAKGEMFHG